MRDVICNAYACSGRKKVEPGLNLAKQERHWKDEFISVEIDIKITKIHGIHPCKDGMAYFKKHVGLKFIGGTH